MIHFFALSLFALLCLLSCCRRFQCTLNAMMVNEVCCESALRIVALFRANAHYHHQAQDANQPPPSNALHIVAQIPGPRGVQAIAQLASFGMARWMWLDSQGRTPEDVANSKGLAENAMILKMFHNCYSVTY
jgi:hypothetical protein